MQSLAAEVFLALSSIIINATPDLVGSSYIVYVLSILRMFKWILVE